MHLLHNQGQTGPTLRDTLADIANGTLLAGVAFGLICAALWLARFTVALILAPLWGIAKCWGLLPCITLAALLSLSHTHSDAREPGEPRVSVIVVLIGSDESMQPLLDAADVLICEPTPFSLLRRGDLVLYRSTRAPSGNIVHRLVERARPDAWVAKGDSNRTADPERVTKENYRARVIAIVSQ